MRVCYLKSFQLIFFLRKYECATLLMMMMSMIDIINIMMALKKIVLRSIIWAFYFLEKYMKLVKQIKNWNFNSSVYLISIIWTISNCCHNFKAKSESVFVYAFVVKQKTNLTWEFQYLSWIMYSHCKSEHQYLVAFLYEVVLSLKHISPHNSETGMKENNASLKTTKPFILSQI